MVYVETPMLNLKQGYPCHIVLPYSSVKKKVSERPQVPEPECDGNCCTSKLCHYVQREVFMSTVYINHMYLIAWMMLGCPVEFIFKMVLLVNRSTELKKSTNFSSAFGKRRID